MNKTLRILQLSFLFLFLQLGSGLKAITVNVATPGTLSTLVTDLTITELTVTGTLDARDFKFIRDKIPDLAVLDLTAVTIAGYVGKGGTAGESSISYPPNTIPQAAFFNALSGVGKDSFTSILLPNLLYTIDDDAFDGCVNLTGTLVIPSTVTNIGVGAFNNCASITGLVLPNTALTIEDNAFFDCTMLTGTLVIPASLEYIGQNAFSRVACNFEVDHGNLYFASRDGVLFDNDSTTLIQCPTSKKGSYTMPKEVIFIGSAAFADCVDLDGILHIGENVTSIGEDAFSGCTGYTGLLTFPNTTLTIGSAAFSGCSGFDSILIPNTIDFIGADAFADCSGLTGKLVIPPSVATIGEGAFVGCSGLSGTLDIPSTVHVIEPNTFKDCTDLVGKLKLEEGVEEIGANAFRECHGFTSVTLPSTVNTIGANAFYNCHSISTLVVEMETPPNLGANTKVFFNVNKDSCTLYVPAGKKALYASLPQWKDFKHIIEGHDFWLSTNDIFVAKQAGSKATANVTVTSNTIWTPTSPDAWLTVSPSVATSGNGVLTFTALTANPLITTRISEVVVSAPGAPNQTIKVTQAAGDPHLEISGQTATLGKEVMAKEKDGAAFITVSSNTTWTVVCDQAWITPSPLTASNDGVLILTANSTNTTGAPRTATVTVSAPGVTSKTITVSQTDVPSYFTIPTVTATVTKEIGSTATIPITSNTTWIASSDQTWLAVGPTIASLGDGNLTVTTTGFNPTTDIRTATVTILVPGSEPKTITVTQAAGDPSLSLPTTTASVTNVVGSTATVPIVSNSTWTATTLDNWISVGPLTSNGDGTLTITTLIPNPTIDVRTTTVTINVPGATPKTITVTQAAGTPTLLVSSPTADAAKELGGVSSVDVTSNTMWTAVCDQAWLSLSPASKTGDGKLVFTVTQKNNTGSPRTALVTLTAPGVASKTVTVTQTERTAIFFTPSPSFNGTKVYDKTNFVAVAVGAISGIEGTDDVSISAVGTYDNENAGTTKAITISYTLGGADKAKYIAPANYTVNTGVITAVSLTVTAQPDTKVYSRTTASSVLPLLTGNLIAGDIVGTAAIQSFDNANVGVSKQIVPSGLVISDGNGGKNYAITYVPNAQGVITKAPVNVSAQMDTKVYDATTNSAVLPVIVGIIAPDTITKAAVQTFSNQNVGGSKVLVPNGLVIGDGNAGLNYDINYVNSSAGVITQAPVSVIAQTDTRVYNGKDSSALVPVVSGVLLPDVIKKMPVQLFNNRHMGVNKTITPKALEINDGNNGANYAVSYVAVANGEISKASITVTAQTDSMIYNRTNISAIAPKMTGLFAPDLVTSPATQTFDNFNAGDNKTITASGLVINDGNAGNNYSITYQSDLTGKIKPLPLTITAQADTKLYDGNLISNQLPILNGNLIAPDAITKLAHQTFDNRNASKNKLLTPSGMVIADGNGGTNYAISYVTNLQGEITPIPLTVTAQTDSRPYNGGISSAVLPLFTGSLIAPDKIDSAAIQTFDNRRKGTGKVITASGLKINDGNLGANYTVNYVSNNTGAITQATVLVVLTVATHADDKVYDGTTVAKIFEAKLNGVVAGDDVKLDSIVGQFKQSNIGIELPVDVDMHLIGLDIDNYLLVQPAGLTATINAKALTVANAIAKDKDYDTNDLALIEGAKLMGVVGTEDVVLANITSGTFATHDPGLNQKVTTAMILSGTAIANYSLTQPNNLKASINPKPLVVADPVLPGVKEFNGVPLPASKVYDGTGAALVTEGLLQNVAPEDLGKVIIKATAIFADPIVGKDKTVTVKYTLSGPNSNHYKAPTDYTYVAGEIIPKALTIATPTVVKNKMVDGKTTAALNTVGSLTGLIAADAKAVTITASANYDNSAPGKNKPIRVVYTLNGASKNNYQAPADYVITDAKISDYVKLDALAAPSNGCQGESLGLGYKIVAGDGVNYKITFDSAALAAGMKNIDYTAFPDTTHSGILSIPIPQTVKDGNFTAKLSIKNELGIESAVNTFPFAINVSADYIVSKFDDVVLCNNFSNRFVNYQWYKDGKKLEGATKQFYYDPAGLNGVYHLQVTTAKNEMVFSCSKSFTKAKAKVVSAYPNPLKVHQRFNVKVEGMKPEELEGASLTIYSLQGMKVYESKNVTEQNILNLDLSIGVYLGKVITSNGLEHSFSVVVGQ